MQSVLVDPRQLNRLVFEPGRPVRAVEPFCDYPDVTNVISIPDAREPPLRLVCLAFKKAYEGGEPIVAVAPHHVVRVNTSAIHVEHEAGGRASLISVKEVEELLWHRKLLAR